MDRVILLSICHFTCNITVLLGPNYIRNNHSAVIQNKQRPKLIKREHDKITSKVKDYLAKYHHVNPTLSIHKAYSDNLQNRLEFHYMTPLSMSDQIRCQREFKIVKSIRHKLKKCDLIQRQTDKSRVFCTLRIQDHEEKVKEYRDKTKAYKELTCNPFEATLNKVVRLLNDLHMKEKKLRAWQYKEMWPNLKKCKLPYMYFNPKTHKVIKPPFSHRYFKQK